MSGPASSAGWDAIAIDRDDDVAVALRDVAAGETVGVRRGGDVVRAVVHDAIPLGHKLALHAIAAGAPVRKYAETIGIATADIAAGAHVHVHNVASRRARRVP